MTTTQELVEMLDWLRVVDTSLQAFGAQTHGYVLQPTLSEEQVAQFERENRIVLPAAYRDFILHAGNGGAGPAYGLRPLEAWHCTEFSQVTTVLTTKSGERFEAGTGERAALDRPSDPARPYPFTEPWRAPGPDETLPIPQGSHPFDGCLHVAEIGCGYNYLLVVTGEAAGQVWADYTAGDGQVAKAADDFCAWYKDWLEEGLMDAAGKKAFDMLWFDANSEPQPETLQVIKVVDRLGAEYPDWVNQHYLRGVLRMYNHDVEGTLASLARSLELAPQDLRPRVMLGRLHELLGEYEAVLSIVEAALALEVIDIPNQAKLYWLRARALSNLGQTEAAIEAATAARQQRYFVYSEQINYGLFLTWLGQSDRAAAALDEYIKAAHGEQSVGDFGRQVYQAMVQGCTAWELPEAAEYYQRRLA